MTNFGESAINPQAMELLLCTEMIESIMNDKEFLNTDNGPPQYFKVQGEIMRIMGDRTMYYTACHECKKKVSPSDSGVGWFCEKC